jgi:hypothetical protein
MATEICSASCGAIPEVPGSYCNACDAPTLRRHGACFFGLIACDVQFTDILDPGEWSTYVAANQIHISPEGTMVKTKSTGNAIEYNGCGKKTPSKVTWTFDFTTYCVGDDLSSDFIYWYNLCQNANNYRFFWFDCNGFFYFKDDWMDVLAIDGGATAPITVASSNPGFSFSLTEVPDTGEGDDNNEIWTIQFEIEKYCSLRGVQLPGVAEQLA